MTQIDFVCPACHERVGIMARAAGMARPCPRCREWVKVPEKSTTLTVGGEGSVEESAEVPEPLGVVAPVVAPARAVGPSGTSPGWGGWSCLGIGLLLMYSASFTWFLYIPLVLVAFILGVVSMAQGRMMNGQLLLICSLVIPAFVAINVNQFDLARWPLQITYGHAEAPPMVKAVSGEEEVVIVEPAFSSSSPDSPVGQEEQKK